MLTKLKQRKNIKLPKKKINYNTCDFFLFLFFFSVLWKKSQPYLLNAHLLNFNTAFSFLRDDYD